MKSFAMLAMSGLLAASFAYIAPVMAADDLSTDMSAMQGAPSDLNSGPDMSNVAGASSTSQSDGMNSSSITGTNSENTDEGNVQDTPSGDDDY